MSIIEIFIISLALSVDAFAVTISNIMANPHLSRVQRLAMPVTFGVFQGLMLLIGYFVGNLAIGYIERYAGPVALVVLAVIGGRMIFEAIRDMRKKKNAESESSKQEATELDAQETSGATSPALAANISEGEASTLSTEISAKEDSTQPTEPSGEEGSELAAETLKTPDEVSDNKRSTFSFLSILAQGVATSLDALIVGVSLAALSVNILVAAPMVGLVTFAVCVVGLAIGKRIGILLGTRAQIVGGIILILIGIRVCFF